MRILEQLGKMFESEESSAASAYMQVLKIIEIPESTELINRLKQNELIIQEQLLGENGSASLVRVGTTSETVIMKTYDPATNQKTGEVVKENNPFQRLREEAAAFFVSVIYPLLDVPLTVLCQISDKEYRLWKDERELGQPDKVIMAQKYIDNAVHLDRVIRLEFLSGPSLLEIIGPKKILGLLCFDYLISYAEGRLTNLLLVGDDIWGIDHGKSFYMRRGSIRNLDSIGIDEDYVFSSSDIKEIISKLDIEKLKKLLPALKILIGDKATKEFADRFKILYECLSQSEQISIKELKKKISSV